MLQVVSDAPDEAQRSLAKALDVDYEAESKAIAWVLASKIGERYGIAEAAGSARQKALSCAPSDQINKWAMSLIKTAKMESDRLPPAKKVSKSVSTP
jgi:hypothetical protein